VSYARYHWCVFGLFPSSLITQTRRFESRLLSKCRVCVITDAGRSPNTHQWYTAHVIYRRMWWWIVNHLEPTSRIVFEGVLLPYLFGETGKKLQKYHPGQPLMRPRFESSTCRLQVTEFQTYAVSKNLKNDKRTFLKREPFFVFVFFFCGNESVMILRWRKNTTGR
jgi:hypothetical protein